LYLTARQCVYLTTAMAIGILLPIREMEWHTSDLACPPASSVDYWRDGLRNQKGDPCKKKIGDDYDDVDIEYTIYLDHGNECSLYQGKAGPVTIENLKRTLADEVEKRGGCKACKGDIAHVIEEGTGKKYCPFAFHRLINPDWKISEILQ